VCPKCGKRFPDEYMFCMECGSELGEGITKPKGKTQVSSRGKGEAKAGKAKEPTLTVARPKAGPGNEGMTGKAKGKSAKIKPESVSVKPGDKELAKTAIEGFFRELRGDITAMLPYIDETTFGYLGKIRDAKSFKILTSNIFPSKAKIDKAVRGLGRPVEIWEITSPRRRGPPVRILHERWVSDGRIFVDIGTDLKWRALGHTQHTIRRDSAKGHRTELDAFNEHWKNVLAGRAKESFGGPVNLQHIVYPEKPERITALPPVREAHWKARKSAERATRGEKIIVPSVGRRPPVGRPAGRGPAGPRAGLRMAWESVLAATGLTLLISSFLVSYGLIGKAPEPSNVAGVAILMAIGVIPTVFWQRGSSDMVRIGGGSTFAAAGLGLLIFSFLATYGLMWETLQRANVVWLGAMIAVGVLLTVTGIPMIHELGDNARKAWGSAFAAASLGALVLCVLVAHDLMGRALQWANGVWLGVMIAVGAFAAWEGFPLVLEPKDRIRMAWEGAFMAAGIGTLVSCVIPVHGLLNKTLETANAVAWLSILIVIGTFLLAKGIGLVRG